MTSFSSQVLVWSHLSFVLGAGRALIMKLLIGFTMGNGIVIWVTPIGNEIASRTLKQKWDDAGLWGRGANRKSQEYCSTGSMRFSCFDKTRGKAVTLWFEREFRWKQQLLGSWMSFEMGKFIYALVIHTSWVVKIYVVAFIYIIAMSRMLTYGVYMH